MERVYDAGTGFVNAGTGFIKAGPGLLTFGPGLLTVGPGLPVPVPSGPVPVNTDSHPGMWSHIRNDTDVSISQHPVGTNFRKTASTRSVEQCTGPGSVPGGVHGVVVQGGEVPGVMGGPGTCVAWWVTVVRVRVLHCLTVLHCSHHCNPLYCTVATTVPLYRYCTVATTVTLYCTVLYRSHHCNTVLYCTVATTVATTVYTRVTSQPTPSWLPH